MDQHKAPPKRRAQTEKKSARPHKKKLEIRSQRSMTRILEAITIVVVLLVFIAIGAYRFGNITFSTVGDYFGALISDTKPGDGYPYYFEHIGVQTVQPIGSDLFVLTEDQTFVLDGTARKLGMTQHAYSKPMTVSIGGRVLMMDVGETNYRVLSKTKVLYEVKHPHKILTGSIGKDGTVAIASRGAEAQSTLSVLGNNQKEIFTWNCAAENIVAVAVSDNGKRAAVSVVGAQNGELYSKVHIFDVRRGETVASFTYQEAVTGLRFLSGKNLLIYGAHTFDICEDDTIELHEDLSLNTLSRVYSNDRHFTAVVLSKYGSSAAKIIQLYDRNGKQEFSLELSESVKGISCDVGHVSVLTDRYLYNYNHKGELVGKVSVEADCLKPITDGKLTYVYATSGMKSYDTVGIAENLENAEPAE